MITLPPEYGDVAGDRVLFQLRAQGGQAPSGPFNVVHIDDVGGLYAHVVGDITCVSASDGVAVTTGIIRHAWFRDFPGSLVVNTGVAITVADNGTSDAPRSRRSLRVLPLNAVVALIGADSSARLAVSQSSASSTTDADAEGMR